MISILIPTYEYNCTELVADLVKLGKDIPVPWEIIVMDDGSTPVIRHQIRTIQNMQKVRYIELKENVGRALVRNYLADESKYENLLFLDSDSKVCRTDYLKKFISLIPNREVLVGGRSYPDVRPKRPFVLHWKYGRIRESASVLFQSNNFVIPKDIFNQIRFDEKLSTYGHEDTLFGWHLKELGITVRRMDNPVEHTKLETTEEFLQKQYSAGSNLIRIREWNPAIHTRLSRAAIWLKKYYLQYPILLSFWFLRKFQVPILMHIPNLWLLDFFKMGDYLNEMGQKKKKAF